MIEISVTGDQQVLARWHGGGPWFALDRDGAVTSTPTDLGAEAWGPDPENWVETHEGRTYDDGYEDGWDEAIQAAGEAVDSAKFDKPPRRRRKPSATPAPRPVTTVAATGGLL